MDQKTYRTLIPIFDELRSERVIVRPYREEDAEALREAVDESREHIRPWLPFADEHQTVEASREWINRQRAAWITRDTLNMCIYDADSGRFLGGVGLMPRDWEIGYHEIGYWLRQSAEGHGYMAEAVRLLVDFAFGSLGANRLEIRCDEKNTRSASVARRLGFKEEGVMRNDSRATDGTLRNTLIFSRIPGD